MTQIQLLTAYVSTYVHHLTEPRRRDERGATDLITMVIVAALFAAGAIAISVILIDKFTGKAESIPTE